MCELHTENMVSLRIWTWLSINENDIGSVAMILILGGRGPDLNPRNALVLQTSTKGVWVLFVE